MNSHRALTNNVPHYLALMRFDKPIGWLLLLWPTWCALWIASEGDPSARLFWIFTIGVIVMRSAGCVINDYADKDFDPLVERTNSRPLASGALNAKQALRLFFVLCLLALLLLLLLPMRVWPWSIPALAVTIIYPFMKRFIQAPQLVLGLAFSFSIPMVYVAYERAFDGVLVLLMLSNFLWVVAYDTMYAMSDREDDLKVGVKSSAIFFGAYDKLIVGALQACVIGLWLLLMWRLNLSLSFLLSLIIVAGLFTYQQWLIRNRERQPCFQAFINNGWVGAVIWIGLLTELG